MTIGFNSFQEAFFVFLTDKKFSESKTNSTPLNPNNSFTKGLAILSISFF